MADYFLETQSHEWIMSNQLGGYALGTGNLINQRKYHALLTSGNETFERNRLISSLEEKVEWRGEEFFLDSNNYNNCIYPEGFLHLVKSWLLPYPIFLYSTLPHNEHILIKKEIYFDKQQNAVMLSYTNLSVHKIHVNVKPKLDMINHHLINEIGTWDHENMITELHSVEGKNGFTTYRPSKGLRVYGYLHHGEIWSETTIYRNVYYPWDVMRGYPGNGDVIATVSMQFDLMPNEQNYLIFSETPIDYINNTIQNIEKEYRKLPLPHDYPSSRKEDALLLGKIDYDDNILFNHSEYMEILESQLKGFIANNDIVAGYPWFGAWGRDTMISLEAYLEIPSMLKTVWSIINKYKENMLNGMLPNMCSESGQTGNYDTCDASLWFVNTYYMTIKKQLAEMTQKKTALAIIKEGLTCIDTVLTAYFTPNKNYTIREDGLLEINLAFAASTWMDAKIDNQPITARNGAPVEINALLYNAICCYEDLIEEFNNQAPARAFLTRNQDYIDKKEAIQNSFYKFWIDDYLADRLVGDEAICEYRPNAIIATSLPFTLLSIDKIQTIYETAHVELYTPYGLRSLSPRDSKFKRKYIGNQKERDLAYHQGAVWAWLLLPFIKTYLKAYPDRTKKEHEQHISYIIERFRNGFMRGHIASIAEIWDGDHPHFPKGAPAQAWSVAAIYYIEKMIEKLEGE